LNRQKIRENRGAGRWERKRRSWDRFLIIKKSDEKRGTGEKPSLKYLQGQELEPKENQKESPRKGRKNQLSKGRGFQKKSLGKIEKKKKNKRKLERLMADEGGHPGLQL